MSSSATHRRMARTRLGTSALALAAAEALIAGFALISGLLLVIDPKGSLLDARSSALSGSPFRDWRLPGVLLMAFVGVGFSVAAAMQWTAARHARLISVLAGAGLIVFESFVMAWLGYQGLEVVFGLVGLAIVVVAISEGQKEHAE